MEASGYVGSGKLLAVAAGVYWLGPFPKKNAFSIRESSDVL